MFLLSQLQGNSYTWHNSVCFKIVWTMPVHGGDSFAG